MSRSENDLLMQRRASTAATLGLVMQLVLGIVAWILALLGQGFQFSVVVVFALAGLIPWTAIVIATAFRKAKTLEEFELEAAHRSGASAATIFESEVDARPAGRRLARVYKFGLPAATILLGLVLALFGFAHTAQVPRYMEAAFAIAHDTLVAGLAAGFAFVGFIFGRYLLGMSTRTAWSLLRGGATYLISTVYLLAIISLSAAAAGLGSDLVTSIAKYVVPAFMLVVGIEMLLNVVLDLYRPRAGEATPRPGFDSRLLALLASPAGVVKGLNEAINYQFGFEITRSWFWRLLSRAFGWLILFGVGVLVLVSSVVIIEPFEKGLLTQLGKLQEEPLEPGLNFKLPWPLATVERYPVARVQEMVVGSHDQIDEHEAYLWNMQHADVDRLLVVSGRQSGRRQETGKTVGGATTQPSGDEDSGAPAVALAAAEAYVQWRIDGDNLLVFATHAKRPAYLLRQIAETALAREISRFDIEGAIGSRRLELAQAVESRIREAVEAEQMGIEILWVGIAGVQPPQRVADSFNESIAAEQVRRQAVQLGQTYQAQTLTQAAGSVEQARDILAKTAELGALRQQTGEGSDAADELARLEAELELLVQEAGGISASLVLDARGERWTTENAAIAERTRSESQVGPYRAAPRYFRARAYMETLQENMIDKNKIMVLADVKDLLLDLDLRQVVDVVSGFGSDDEDDTGQ